MTWAQVEQLNDVFMDMEKLKNDLVLPGGGSKEPASVAEHLAKLAGAIQQLSLILSDMQEPRGGA